MIKELDKEEGYSISIDTEHNQYVLKDPKNVKINQYDSYSKAQAVRSRLTNPTPEQKKKRIAVYVRKREGLGYTIDKYIEGIATSFEETTYGNYIRVTINRNNRRVSSETVFKKTEKNEKTLKEIGKVQDELGKVRSKLIRVEGKLKGFSDREIKKLLDRT